jgi:uncharacterized membrane protein YjdF
MELIEWWTAVATGEAAEAFLGTQGDVWDTQWDMMLALIGTILALLVLSRLHMMLALIGAILALLVLSLLHDRQLAGRSTGRPAPDYYLATND